MYGKRERHGPRALSRSLRADRSGIALGCMTVTLPLIIAFAVFALAVSRVNAHHSWAGSISAIPASLQKVSSDLLLPSGILGPGKVSFQVSAIGTVPGDSLRTSG